jgi:hypothetical protein
MRAICHRNVTGKLSSYLQSWIRGGLSALFDNTTIWKCKLPFCHDGFDGTCCRTTEQSALGAILENPNQRRGIAPRRSRSISARRRKIKRASFAVDEKLRKWHDFCEDEIPLSFYP